jgi:hypothetical protein
MDTTKSLGLHVKAEDPKDDPDSDIQEINSTEHKGQVHLGVALKICFSFMHDSCLAVQIQAMYFNQEDMK